MKCLMRKQITHLDETDTTTAGGAVTKNRSILGFSFIYFVFLFPEKTKFIAK